MQLRESHLKYLTEERGLDPEIALRHGVYTGKYDKATGRGVADPRGNLIIFPFRDRGGVVVNEKFRTADKKFWQWPGAQKTFWNAEVLDDQALLAGSPLVITEGEPDGLAVEQAGFPLVVSVPDGAPPPRAPGSAPEPIDPDSEASGKFDFMWHNRDRLKRVKRFTIAVDGDPAGQRLAEELVRRLGASRCWFVTWPPGCKDANDVLKRDGAEALARVLNQAKPYPVRGVYRLSDYPDLPEPVAYSTGWPSLDEYLKLWLGEVAVVTGVPGHGKTTWVTALLANLAELHGWRAGIFSPEVPIVPYLRRKFRRLRLGKSDYDPAEAAEADRWIDRNFVFFDYDQDGSEGDEPDEEEGDISLEWVLERGTDAVRRYGIRVFVIDPWNELDHARRPGESEHQYIGRALRMIRRWAKRNQVVVIIVAHPTKDIAKEGRSRRPTLYDIDGSSHFFNKPDHGLVIDTPNDDNGETVVFIRKVRFENTGKKGNVTLLFDKPSSRYEDMQPGMMPIWKAAEQAAKSQGKPA